MLRGVLCKEMFVVTSPVNRLWFGATIVGGTVIGETPYTEAAAAALAWVAACSACAAAVVIHSRYWVTAAVIDAEEGLIVWPAGQL